MIRYVMEQNYQFSYKTVPMSSWVDNTQSYKISIAKVTSNPRLTFNDRPAPIMRDHISWEDENVLENDKRKSKADDRSRGKPRRRKIFQQHTSPQHIPRPQPFGVQTYNGSNQDDKLRKVKSNGQLPKKVHFESSSDTIDSRLQEINRRLNSRREERMQQSFASASFREHSPRDNGQQWLHLQQKINQSTQTLKRHEQVIHKKLPVFEKKLQANNRAISNLKTKFEQSNLQLNSSLKHSQLREEELSKMNSSLLMKEGELMENKEQNRRKELELIRMQRIENLQKGNLQLYQALQKGTFSHFENLRQEETNEEGVENVIWDDEQPSKLKFSRGQESTIRWQPNPQDLSANNTIGQILSPLVLSEYQYCL